MSMHVVARQLRPLISVVTVLSFTILCRNLHGAWPTSTATGLQTFTPAGTLVYSQSFSDGMGGLFVLWRNDGEGAPRARHIDSAGVPIGPSDGLLVWTDDVDHFLPKAAPDGQGGLLVVRASKPTATSDTIGLYVQRLDPTAARLWGDSGVLLSDVSTEGFSVDNDDNGGAYVAWHEDKGSGTGIYAQRVAANGSVLWTSGGITVANADFFQVLPQLVADGGGSAIVAWEDFRNGVDTQIFAQYLNPNGVVGWQANGIRLGPEEHEQHFIAGSADGLGGAIFGWLELGDDGTNIHGQRIAKSGELRWTDDGLNVTPFIASQVAPEIVRDGTGGAYFVWRDFLGASEGDVFAQHVKSDGKLDWDKEGESVQGNEHLQHRPTATLDGDGGVYVGWEDSNGFIGGTPAVDVFDIFAQRLAPDAERRFIFDGGNYTPITLQPAHQYGPSMFPDGRDGAIVTWYSTPDLDHTLATILYAARMRRDGTLGDDATSVPRDLVGVWTKAEVTPKDDGTLKVKSKLTVTNFGTRNAQNFTVRIVLSTDTKYDALDPVVETKSMKDLKAGKSVKVSGSEKINPNGLSLHYLIGVVDLAETISESNEADNEVLFTF